MSVREQDVEILIAQIRNIILNKPITDVKKTENAQLIDLQDAISYLANCLSEGNEFLKNLSEGNLNVATPSRHNFLASSLKELHAGLRHITWQAGQVANGDYKQKVSFLGEFSTSFNKMAAQLEERENALKKQTDALTHSMNLLVAVMDGLHDFVLVTEKDTQAILYTNQAAQERFYDINTGLHICGTPNCEMFDCLFSEKHIEQEDAFEYTCPKNNKTWSTKTFAIQWSGKMAYVHFISDITGAKEQKNQLEYMAFKDELTGLYNRRYGIRKLSEMIAAKKKFAVCLIDLDQLKLVNDKLGHTLGDEYITTVTSEMTRLCGEKCNLFRVGGDEFVALLDGGTEQEMRAYATELERSIAAIHRSYTMAISCGILGIEENTTLTTEQVMACVDEKMYAIKNKKKQRRAAAYSVNA